MTTTRAPMRRCAPVTSCAGALLVAACVSTSPACGQVSSECDDYLACQIVVDPSLQREGALRDYEEGGACWATPSSSRACSAQCIAALAALASIPDAPPECAP